MTNNTVLFRCNASLQTGSGHVMRCLTLAKELFNKGINAVFLTDEGGKKVIEQFAACPIHTELRDEGFTEYEQLGSTIIEHHARYMVWDSYDIESGDEIIISGLVPVMIIDDTYLLPSYSCDAILNQNIYADAIRYNLADSRIEVLAGSSYTLLREPFRRYSDTTKYISAVVHKVVVTFGGSDPENLTLRMIDILEQFQDHPLDIGIVLGSHYAFEESIQIRLLKNPYHKYRLYRNVIAMAELLWEQDYVITASGSTMYELAILGIPSTCIVTADNQLKVAQSFDEQGATIYGGNADSLNIEKFVSEFRNIIHNFIARQEMSIAGRKLIDGNGVRRVANYIMDRMNVRELI